MDYSFSFPSEHGFPSDQFTVTGNPASLREAATKYANFGKTASDAATSVRNLNTGSWTGDEAEQARQLLSKYPGPLSDVGTAFGDVHTALTTFAGVLETEQAKMATERAAAQKAWDAKVSAHDAASKHGGTALDKLGMSDAQRDDWNQRQSALDNAATSADNAWNTHVTNAKAIQGRVQEAAAAAKRQIHAAADESPTAHQNWFEKKWEQAGNWIDDKGAGIRKWIGDHAHAFRFVGKALEWLGDGLMIVGVGVAAICTVAGFFSFGVGFLGDIPAGMLIGFGSALSGVGSGLQTAADWGEGKIDGKGLLLHLGINAGLTIATAGIGKLAVKAGSKLIPRILERNPKLAGALERLFGKGREPRLPGTDGDIARATASQPVTHTYRNPVAVHAGAPAPSPLELKKVKLSGKYPPDSRERLIQQFRKDQAKAAKNGTPPPTWAESRDAYIAKIGQNARAQGFEDAFAQHYGFHDNPDWRAPVPTNPKDGTLVPGRSGASRTDFRYYDQVNEHAKQAYELKSGKARVDDGQLAKDIEFQKAGWQVIYVFENAPSAGDIAKLEAAHMPWDVMHTNLVQVP